MKVVYLCRPLFWKGGMFFKYLEFSLKLSFKGLVKGAEKDKKVLVEIKKPLPLHSRLQKGQRSKAERSLKVWKQQHVNM